jgi:hypothetical protein
MSTHAQLSPSKRHRWALCPGSVREEAKFPEERNNAAAIDGTHTHTLLEHCINNGLSDPTGEVGEKFADDDGEFVVDADRAARVKIAIDYIKERVKDCADAQVISETRVDPKWFTGRDDLSGTVDVQIIAGNVLEIIDYKDGMAPVEAENNLQLEQYAIGKLAECKLPINMPAMYPWREVRMTIIQPKLALKGMQPIVTWIVPVSYLLQRTDELFHEALATDAVNAPLVPGESQCKYCRAKGSCSALASNVMKEVGVMFQPVNQTLDIAQQSADKDPATMSDDQIRQIMEAAPLMRQLLEGVEKEALRRLESGQSINGLKLVHGRGSRAWNLPEEQIAEKLVKMGIPKSAIYETKLVSPAKAEKLTWEKRDGSKVSLSELQLKRLEQEYVSKLAGKLTVVSESDSRPAVVTNAAPLFSAVEVAPAAESLPSWLM